MGLVISLVHGMTIVGSSSPSCNSTARPVDKSWSPAPQDEDASRVNLTLLVCICQNPKTRARRCACISVFMLRAWNTMDVLMTPFATGQAAVSSKCLRAALHSALRDRPRHRYTSRCPSSQGIYSTMILIAGSCYAADVASFVWQKLLPNFAYYRTWEVISYR